MVPKTPCRISAHPGEFRDRVDGRTKEIAAAGWNDEVLREVHGDVVAVPVWPIHHNMGGLALARAGSCPENWINARTGVAKIRIVNPVGGEKFELVGDRRLVGDKDEAAVHAVVGGSISQRLSVRNPSPQQSVDVTRRS